MTSGLPRKVLTDALDVLSRKHCAYIQPNKEAGTKRSRCDCKYGYADKDRRSNGEVSGCPELALTRVFLEALTPAEWARLCKRLRMEVHPDDKPKKSKTRTRRTN